MKKGSKNSSWCEEEDVLIAEFVKVYGTKNWAKISQELDNNGYKKKTGKQCRERWHNHLDPLIVKKGWSPHEEQTMFEEHKKHGNKWTIIAASLPGRTDNAIKNHFYSTIRRSMRRMNKLLGSKNSTMKMRKIKPSTLSKIFALAEGRSHCDGSKANNALVSADLHEICRQILGHLMEFSKLKPSKNDELMSFEEIKKFEKVMEEMIKINDLYEGEKAKQAKQKRQRKLEKNFDEAIASEEESQVEEQQDEVLSLDNPIQSPSEQPHTTRSNRKVKPPMHFVHESNHTRKRESPRIEEPENKRNDYFPTSLYFDQQILSIPNLEDANQNGDKDEYQNLEFKKQMFHLDLDDDNLQMNSMERSPNFLRNTPFALTPIQGLFSKDLQVQPSKNEDYDVSLHNLIMKIHKNSNNPGSQPKRNQNSLQSPSSAFRQCF